jgi:5-methylcytosine-specific restriction endonuclease McrA
MEIQLPEVIQLSFFNSYVRHEVQFSRKNIFVRDKHQCQYCGARPPKNELSIDHVVPRSRGGLDHWDNLVLACKACNCRKGDRTPEEARMHLLRKPRAPQWLPRLGHPVPPGELGTWQRFVDTSCWAPEI